jgi:hypothetical protein
MSVENIDVVVEETLEICDLEYDVAAVGSTETATAEQNHAALTHIGRWL